MAASYPAVIDLRVNNLAALDKLEAGTKRVTGLFNEIRQQRNLFDQSVGKAATREVTRNIGKLIAGFAGAKEGARQFQVTLQKTTKEGTVEATKNVNMYSKTLAGLGSQLRAVDQILANSTVGQKEFNDALVVSNKLSRELTRNQLKAAAAEAKAGAGGVQGLLALGKQLPNSVKALELYQAELNDLQITVDRTSKDFFELGKEIKRVDLLLARGPQQKATGRGGGRGAGGGRRGGRFQDIATGAGFPLLFGGGPVQALAGGIGGAIGGLGGSIAASAISAQVEQVVKASAELGQALNPLTLDLERVAEASGFAGTETQQFLQKIEKYAEATEAARLATALLETKVGKDGVKALKDFGESAVTLGNNLSVIFTQILAAIAKAAGPLLDGLAKFAGEQADVGSFLARGPGTSQEKLAQEILKTNFSSTKGELTTSSSQALQEFSKRSVGLGGQGFKTAAEAKTFATGVASSSQRRVEQPVLQEIETLAGTLGPEEKTKKGPKGRESRLPQLQAEVKLQERLAVLTKQIAKAKADKDPAAQAALEIEVALEKKATAIQKINLEKITAAEKLEKIKLAEIDANNKVFDINNKVKIQDAKRAEEAAKISKGLQNEQNLLQARLDGRLEEEQLEQRVGELMEKNTDLTKEQVEGSLKSTAALKEQVKALEKLESMYASIGQSISSGIVDALSAAVEGTKSLADVASQTLRQVANILLQFGVNTALGGIPGLGDFFKAKGGPVSGGSPYMVGEKGPELFVPNTSGNIVPNNKLGGGGGGGTNVVVNVDAKGSSASGDSGAGKQLGGLIGAAVQAELIKQQRPGGLLSS